MSLEYTAEDRMAGLPMMRPKLATSPHADCNIPLTDACAHNPPPLQPSTPLTIAATTSPPASLPASTVAPPTPYLPVSSFT